MEKENKIKETFYYQNPILEEFTEAIEEDNKLLNQALDALK